MADKHAYELTEIFKDIELYLAKKIYDNFGDFESSGSWRAKKLIAIEKFRKDNKTYLSRYAKDLQRIVRESMYDSYKRGRSSQEAKEQKAIRKGHRPPKKAPPLSSNDVNGGKIVELINSAHHNLTEKTHAILRQADDVYRQTIFKSQMFFATGSVTLPQAIDMATKDFLSRGLATITYKDGRIVPIDTYAEMYLRTNTSRAFVTGEGTRRNEWGESLVISTSKGAACPFCLEWQGVVMIDDVYSGGSAGDYGGKYPLLSTAIASGYYHPNCKDSFTGYYPGINDAPGKMTDAEISEAQRVYKLEQRQRYNERQVRKYKRLEAGSVEPGNKEKYGGKVKAWQAEQRRFISGNPELRRDYTREKDRLSKLQLASLPTSGSGGASPSGFDLQAELAKARESYTRLPPKASQALDNVLKDAGNFNIDKNSVEPMYYDPNKYEIVMNPDHSSFSDIDFPAAIAHEAAHKMDYEYLHSHKDKDFANAVSDASDKVTTDSERFSKLLKKEEYYDNMTIGDVISALSEGELNEGYYHEKDYWSQKGSKELEIFADMFSSLATEDEIALNFIKSEFPGIFEAFNKLVLRMR